MRCALLLLGGFLGGCSYAFDPALLDAATDAPALDAPALDAPVLDAPTLDAPVLDAPALDAPALDAPVLDAPALDAPALDAPDSGVADAGPGPDVCVLHYLDEDGDGYGTVRVTRCGAAIGFVALPGDCDDGDPGVSPGRLERCEGRLDENCDGRIDEDPAACSASDGARAVCGVGTCAVLSCPSGRFDCDGDAGNGCEAASCPFGPLPPIDAWQLAGPGTERVRAIAVRDDGSVALAGSGNMPWMLDGFALPGAGTEDGFVALLDPAGEVLWARSFGGAGVDVFDAVAIDADRVCAVGNTASSTLDADGTTLTGSSTSTDVLVVCVGAADGRVRSAWRWGGTGADTGAAALLVDRTLYVGGTFLGSATIAGRTLTTSPLTEADGFVAQEPFTAGCVLRAGGTGAQNVRALASGPGGIAAGGLIYGVGDFVGAVRSVGVPAVPSSNGDAWLAEIDGCEWGAVARLAAIASREATDHITALGTGWAAAGSFSGDLPLGGGGPVLRSIDPASTDGAAVRDVFVVGWDGLGSTLSWGYVAANAGRTTVTGLGTLPDGRLAVAGGFVDTLSLGATPRLTGSPAVAMVFPSTPWLAILDPAEGFVRGAAFVGTGDQPATALGVDGDEVLLALDLRNSLRVGSLDFSATGNVDPLLLRLRP